MESRVGPFDRSDADPSLEARLGVGLLRLQQALASSRGAAAREIEASPLGLQILIDVAGRGGATTASWLAARYGVTAATVSDALRTLTDRGWVSRTGAPRDARRSLLRLTPAGRRRVNRLDRWGREIEALVRTIPTERRGLFLEDLLEILRELERRGKITTDRMCVTCRYFRKDRHEGPKPHHCELLDAPLAPGDLRIDCDEHAVPAAPAG